MLETIWQGAQHVCGVKLERNFASRKIEHIRVRWLAMYVARRKGFSHNDIGRFFDMHHTTVMHGVLSFEKQDCRREVRLLEEYLESPPVPVKPASETELRDRLVRIEQLLDKQIMLEKLPVDREGVTHHFSITYLDGEEVKVFDAYITANVYGDGRLGEFFITAGRDSNVHAMYDIWAISTSRLLQRGEPLEFLKKFFGVRVEPSGPTSNKDIPRCSSVVDYVARYLFKQFSTEIVDEVQFES